MPYAIVDAEGLILGVFQKPNPFMVIPQGGRMLPHNPPEFDHEVADCVTVEPVPPDAQAVEFSVSPKDAALVESVWMRRNTAAIQRHMDAKAQENHYDGILSAASYAGSPHPKFGPEGTAYRDWRDACWAYGYKVMEDVTKGLRQMPSETDLIQELPQLLLPG